MGLDPAGLPGRFTRCLDPEARKELGLEGIDELEPLPTKSQVLASARRLRTIGKLERDEQNTFAAWLGLREADGVLCFDWSRMDRRTTCRRGLPDFRLYAQGRVLLGEMKVGAGKLSADQEVMIEKFARSGTQVQLWHSAAEAIERTRDWLMSL